MKLILICISIIIICVILLVRSNTPEEEIKPLVTISDIGYTAEAKTQDGKCLRWTVIYKYPKNITYQLKEITTIREFIKQRKRIDIIGFNGNKNIFEDC